MQTPAVPTTERARLIMQTLLQMEKQFGKGSCCNWVRAACSK